MPRRDETEFLDLPELRAEAPEGRIGVTGPRATVTPPPKRPVRPDGAAGESVGSRFLVVIALLLAFGAGVWAFLLQQTLSAAKIEIAQSQSRISELERRLSSSDDSWNQSSAAMTVKLKEVAEKSDKLWQEMDKLWASAWRRNQKDIGDQAALLKKQAALLKTQSDALESLRKSLDAESTQSDQKLAEIEKALAARQKTLDDAVTRFNKVAADQANLTKRVQANEEWIEAINTHRKQINQQLDSLRRSVDALAHTGPGAGQLQ